MLLLKSLLFRFSLPLPLSMPLVALNKNKTSFITSKPRAIVALCLFTLLVIHLAGCSKESEKPRVPAGMTIAEMLEKERLEKEQTEAKEHVPVQQEKEAAELGGGEGVYAFLETSNATIHSYTAPNDGQRANSHIIETNKALVLVDVPIFRPYAEQFKALTDTFNKPIERIYLTSPVIDHWGGLDVFSGVDIYTDAAIISQMQGVAEALPEHYADLMISSTPNIKPLLVHSDAVDGLTYEFERVENGEQAPRLIITLPEVDVIFAQDLVTNNTHSYLAGVDLQAWILNLAALTVDAQGKDIFTGHGLPARVTAEHIGRQIRYLQQYKKYRDEADYSVRERAAKMIEDYPEFQAQDVLYWQF